MEELKEDLKTKKFRSMYLFFGEENYLKNYYETKFKDSILDEAFRMMNLDEFEGKTVGVQSIIDSAYTTPFMSEHRLVVVKESGLFTTGRKEDTEKLTSFLSNLPSSTIIIFVEINVDKRSKLYKAVSKAGLPVELKILKESEVVSWTIELFKERNKSISRDCAITLVRTVPHNMDTIALEVDKLINYKGDIKKITEEDINIVCTKSLETKIFELVKAVGEKNLEKSLDIYSNLIIMKEQPIMILAMIARQFRLILQCKDLATKGNSIDDTAAKLGIRSFIAWDCVKQSEKFKFKTLLKAINECLETDINIKTGKANPKLAVEIFLIKYANI